jgi:hypothetical protein
MSHFEEYVCVLYVYSTMNLVTADLGLIGH